MELMISAASPRQMLTGKVVGIGAAGLTQYLAIAVPALILLLFQDRIAEAVLGSDWASGHQLVGLTPRCSPGAGSFPVGFAFALIYAAISSLVEPRPMTSRRCPCRFSLVAMARLLDGDRRAREGLRRGPRS